MKLFEKEINLKKEIDNLNKQQLEDKFKSLEQNKKIILLIKWFGIEPLFNQMINKEAGLKHLKEELYKEI